MIPIYQDPGFTFRFDDDRIIPRFHLEAVEPGRRTRVYRLDSRTGKRLDLLATAVTSEGGWVNLEQPLLVRAGEGFVAVPAPRVRIRLVELRDRDAVRRVVSLAFASDLEAELIDALRAGGFVKGEFVAEVDDAIVGHVVFTELPIVTNNGVVSALALAPLAVMPALQNQGTGTALVESGLEWCRTAGYQIVVVLGHPHFYGRFGFSSERARRLESPYPRDSFMALELIPGALDSVTGRVQYAAPFEVF